MAPETREVCSQVQHHTVVHSACQFAIISHSALGSSCPQWDHPSCPSVHGHLLMFRCQYQQDQLVHVMAIKVWTCCTCPRHANCCKTCRRLHKFDNYYNLQSVGVRCRLSQLRRSGLLPNGDSLRALPNSSTGTIVPTASCTLCPSLDVEQSEAVSSGSGPAPPWPTPAQLKQTLAAFGRAQAEENAHILASRCCFMPGLTPSQSSSSAVQSFISLSK